MHKNYFLLLYCATSFFLVQANENLQKQPDVPEWRPIDYADIENMTLDSLRIAALYQGAEKEDEYQSYRIALDRLKKLPFVVMNHEARVNRTPGMLLRELRETEILTSKTPNYRSQDIRTAFNAIDRTVLPIGKIELELMISNPTSDAHELRTRQTIIQEFTENLKLLETATILLDQLKPVVASSLQFLDATEKNAATLKKYYFQNHWYTPAKITAALNKNSVLLDICNRYEWMPNLVKNYAATVGIGYSTGVVTATIIGFLDGSITLNTIGQHVTTLRQRLANALHELQQDRITKNVAIATPFIYCIPYRAYYSSQATQQRTHDLTAVQESLTDLQKLFILTKQIQQLIAQNSTLSTLLPCSTILTQFPNSDEADIKLDNLEQAVNSSSFTSKGLSWSPFDPRQGRTLQAHTVSNDQSTQTDIVKLLRALGQLDAYVSIAKLFKEFESKRVSYCFPTFYDQKTRTIEMNAGWNPIIDPAHAVANDMMIGEEHGTRNVNLTGSNGGGKSTFTTGIFRNLWLAQSIGIAPSKKLSFTPYDNLMTIFNIGDQPGRRSTSQSEAYWLAQAVTLAKKSSPENSAFIAGDEIPKGISPKLIEQLRDRAIKEILKHPDTTLFMAFNPNEESYAEKETCKGLTDYKIESNPDGTPTHKVTLGRNKVNTAVHVFNTEFEKEGHGKNFFGSDLRSPEKSL